MRQDRSITQSASQNITTWASWRSRSHIASTKNTGLNCGSLSGIAPYRSGASVPVLPTIYIHSHSTYLVYSIYSIYTPSAHSQSAPQVKDLITYHREDTPVCRPQHHLIQQPIQQLEYRYYANRVVGIDFLLSLVGLLVSNSPKWHINPPKTENVVEKDQR